VDETGMNSVKPSTNPIKMAEVELSTDSLSAECAESLVYA
jgi:hypothetical protein